MAYIGLEPKSNNNLRDYFAGTGAQTTFTLSANPGGANGIIVVISGILQKAGVSYFVSAKTLTFSEAPPVPVSPEVTNIEVIYLQRIGTTPTVNWKAPSASGTYSTNNIIASYSPANVALTDGLILEVNITGSNPSAAPTFTPDGLITKPITNQDGTAVPSGVLTGDILLKYDLATTSWKLVGVNYSVSAASDAGFVDNSAKSASTSWVRGAMAVIFTAAGFNISLAANGYIKLPSFLGGLIIQWGSIVNSATPSTIVTVTFPTPFTTACYAVVIGNASSSTSGITCTATSKTVSKFDSTCSVASVTSSWIAIGY